MMTPDDFISASDVRKLLADISIKTLNRWRANHWTEGVHYCQPGHKVIYIKPMIIDWMINHKADPAAHQRAVEAWVAANQHQPAQPRARRNAG
jgi:hypothetical protein